MRKFIATLLVMMIAVSTAPVLAGNVRYEGDGFKSPEAAVEAYLAYFNQGDLNGMLSTFAIETAADHMDQRAAAERMGVFLLSNIYEHPVINDYTRNLAVARIVDQVTRSLTCQFYNYAWPEAYGVFDGTALPLKGDDAKGGIEAFYSGFETSGFADWFGNIAFERYIAPEDLNSHFFMEENQDSIEKQRLIYGCDELAERAAVVRIAGEEYIQFMECARFGDRWYNYSLNGNLAALCNLSSYTGGLIPVDELYY